MWKGNLLNNGEFMICLSCGVQNDMIIDHNQEWRNYNNDGTNKINQDVDYQLIHFYKMVV